MTDDQWASIDSHWYHQYEGNIGWSDLIRSAGLAAAAHDRPCIVHRHKRSAPCERERGGCLVVNPDHDWAGSKFQMDLNR